VKYGHQLFFPNTPGYVPYTSSLVTSETMVKLAAVLEKGLTNLEDMARSRYSND